MRSSGPEKAVKSIVLGLRPLFFYSTEFVKEPFFSKVLVSEVKGKAGLVVGRFGFVNGSLEFF
ncbi:MAG: hypothetical protein K9J45_13525 [Bacteroidales bacterium]|nr:hypothetical protein [Bacteroidales bacterium]MCF8313080.1 hypothetical protein [Saprospiraceae bacterium]